MKLNNKYIKKLMAILLACLLVVGLTACAGQGNDSATSQPASQTAAADSAETKTETTTPEGEAGQPDTGVQTGSDAAGTETAEPEPTAAPEEPKPQAPEVYLRDIYAEYGIKAGTCLTRQMITDKDYNELILKQFSSITMENAMKPDSIYNKTKSAETGEIVVEFSRDALRMLEWAKENGMAVRGHTIVWYSQTPDWIFKEGFKSGNGLVGREEMLARLESMMKNIFGTLEELGYLDLFYAYDIINEAWMENGSMRENNWIKTIGEDYMWYAFYYADKYAPEHIDLYYNDYNEQMKTSTLVNFVKTLVDEDGRSLIDGIGLQAHLYTQDSISQYMTMLDKLGETGLKLQITELDVSLGSWQKSLSGNDETYAKQGRFYYSLIYGVLERVASGKIKMDSITFWGFNDALSWRSKAKPLLFKSDLTPKPAFYGAAQVREFAGYDD